MSMETGNGTNESNNELGHKSPYNYGAQHSMDSGSGPQGEITPPYTGQPDDLENISSDVPAEHTTAAETPPPPSTFGLERFAGTEPQFNGDPPAKYLAETAGSFLVKTRYNKDFLQRHELFYDHISAVSTLPQGGVRANTIEYLPLEYHTPEGVIAVDLYDWRTDVRTINLDGTTYTTRYYVNTEFRDDATHYKTLRKIPGVGIFDRQAVPDDMSHNDIDLQRIADAKRWSVARTGKIQHGTTDVFVGVEEAAYVTDEILANASPPIRTSGDLAAVIRRSALQDGIITSSDADPHTANIENLQAATELFGKVVQAYRYDHVTPEHIINQIDATEARLGDGTTKTVVIRTDNEPRDSNQDPPCPFVQIDRVERSSSKDFEHALHQRGMAVPASVADSSLVDYVRVGMVDDYVQCEFFSKLVDNTGNLHDSKTYRFLSPRAVIEVLRNYLLLGEDVPDAI